MTVGEFEKALAVLEEMQGINSEGVSGCMQQIEATCREGDSGETMRHMLRAAWYAGVEAHATGTDGGE